MCPRTRARWREKSLAKMYNNPKKCLKCGTCVATCPQTIYYQKDKHSVPELSHPQLCISCGHCVAICPEKAITHMDFPVETIKSVNQDNKPSIEQVFELIKTRRAIRAFSDKLVEKEVIAKIVDGARFAPSSHNLQSTEFIVIQDREVLSKIVDLTASYLAKTKQQLRNPIYRRILTTVARNEIEGTLPLLPDFDKVVDEVKHGKDTVLFRAPILLLFHADKSVNFSEVNALLALQNASLVAYTLGLGSFLPGYVVSACKRDKRIPVLVAIPNNHQIYGALALGYPKYRYKNWIERKLPRTNWL